MFRERLAPIRVLSPTYPAHRPKAAVDFLLGWMSAEAADSGISLIGSSMGGFYAQYLARRFPVRHVYMINPALKPWDLLPEYLGPQHNEATGERYELRQEDADATLPYGIEELCDGIPTTLFLDRADQIIDYRIAETMYRDCGRLEIYPGGSHLFRHMDEAVELIRRDYSL